MIYPHKPLPGLKNGGTFSLCHISLNNFPLSSSVLEKGMETHSSILAWESHGQRSLAGPSPWDHKESDVTERLTHTLSFSVHNSFAMYVLFFSVQSLSHVRLFMTPSQNAEWDVQHWLGSWEHLHGKGIIRMEPERTEWFSRWKRKNRLTHLKSEWHDQRQSHR